MTQETAKKKVIFSKGSGGGNTSVESLMDDTPSNYNAANQRMHSKRDGQNSTTGFEGMKKKRKKKRVKKVV